MKYLIITLLLFLASCSSEKEMNIENTPKIIEELSSLKLEVKFKEKLPFYPGAPNEAIREAAQAVIDSLIDDLVHTPSSELNISRVLKLFEASGVLLQYMDSEELERGLEYMEEIMDIYSIESSNGLLNDLRYGFDPEN
ncbi:DUF4844 domain-containing protein [Teredinibacter haidensis]|uniref:DUF4844 domain-containing protein n=1 Tax=Teredinibacter haidensis TaxID=2731755 RepID=UPI000948ADFD|nr:DUF4844 domain-containing protein [Teredinibacter haidensis]